MKKEKLKGFISGVIVTSLVFALSFTAFAAAGSQSIQVAYDNIKIYVNEKLTPMVTDGQTVEPFTYQGRTYVPLNAVATALGQKVGWDGNTNSVYIGTQPQKTDNPPTKTDTTSFSRTNAAPIGTPQTITVDGHTVTIEISSAFRGQTAWAAIRDANRFNDAPADTKEYILLAVKATVDKIDGDGSVTLNKYDFKCFSSTDSKYEQVANVDPDPKFGGSAFEGGKIEGFMSFEVDKSDAAPKIAFGQNRDGSGGIWFQAIESK